MTNKFLQINLHHAVAAVENLRKRTEKSNEIVFITEPYLIKDKITKKSKISGLNGRTLIADSNEPRAALMLPKQIPAFKMTDFTNRDIATATIKINDKWVIITSLYCDIKKHSISQTLVELCIRICG